MDIDSILVVIHLDQKIKQSDTQMINSSRWTTIPHHGSSTSKELRMILKRNIDCASCTTYLNQPLPRTEVLDLYKTPEGCRVHVTQKDKQSIFFLYGVIEYDICSVLFQP